MSKEHSEQSIKVSGTLYDTMHRNCEITQGKGSQSLRKVSDVMLRPSGKKCNILFERIIHYLHK